MKRSIAFVLPWTIDYDGGVNEVVRNLIEECRLAGDFHPVFIESHWASPRPAVEQRPGYTYIRVRLRALDNKRFKTPFAFFASLPVTLTRLASLAREHEIEVFNVHYPSFDALNWIALRKSGLFAGKVILSFHGSDIRTAHGLAGWVRAAYRYLLRHADVIACCSKDLLGEVAALEPDIKGSVVYNGIDEGRFARGALPANLPAGLEQKELILNIGRYEFRKGHDVLLRAFARVREQRPAAHLLIVGTTGPDLEKIRASVSASTLKEHISLLVDLPHAAIPGMLAAAQLFVLSSRWIPGKMGEGFPLAILEAAVAGKPVITTRTCGASEIIEDRVTGRLVPLEDAEALAKAICESLGDRAGTQAMAAALRQKVRTEFTWRRAYQAYASLFRA